MRKPLPLIKPAQTGLGAPTIMDRELAQRHGSRYVQLAAFAIDVDRVCQALADDESVDDASLPLGWEVFVTEAFMLTLLDGNDEAQHSLLEDVCLDLLVDQADPRLGSQLPFAVFDAVTRAALPTTLGALFHRWKSPSKTLLADLAALWAQRDVALPKLAQMCLDVPLDPPLSPPTQQALRSMLTGS